VHKIVLRVRVREPAVSAAAEIQAPAVVGRRRRGRGGGVARGGLPAVVLISNGRARRTPAGGGAAEFGDVGLFVDVGLVQLEELLGRKVRAADVAADVARRVALEVVVRAQRVVVEPGQLKKNI
jgi:hypothetical protein